MQRPAPVQKPVAVQLDFAEWQRVEPVLREQGFIDYLNGRPQARAYLSGSTDRWDISHVTHAEVLVGATPGLEPTLRGFLDAFVMLDIDRDTAALAARLRRAHRWKLPDAFQAALAQQHGLKLATRNTKDFDPARDPFVPVPCMV